VGSGELSLELTRAIPAGLERVVGCFTDAAQLAQWWGPRGFSIPTAEFAPRSGATYRIEMQPPQGASFQLTGTFHEVDLPRRLAFSFKWVPPDPEDVETIAELSFAAIGDSTQVDLVQGPFKAEERRALHRDGWTEALDKLVELVSPRP
jgi:uncharacterized protein YndB with AHSA1/START domain